MEQDAGRKRKLPAAASGRPGPRKRRNIIIADARNIATQTSGNVLKNGELDVDKFVKSRQFEINAFEHGMQQAKSVLSTRAFQSVPKDLRRRTASHDVKRIPKRLRSRAKKEMAQDNTPIGSQRKKQKSPKAWLRIDAVKMLKEAERKKQRAKAAVRAARKASQSAGNSLAGTKPLENAAANAGIQQLRKPRHVKEKDERKRERLEARLAKPPRPKAKFRKRQVHKSWLPTHLFHAKRAHMTPPKEPLWRMAIPLSPTNKSYRPTHIASRTRGCIAWDMSYMSTIGLEGTQANIVKLLDGLGFGALQHHGFWETAYSKRWVHGYRSWSGWLCRLRDNQRHPIAPVTIIWCADVSRKPEPNAETSDEQKSCRRKVFLRVHPSAFLELWEEALKICKEHNSTVKVEDLRFEIGSIEMTGPASMQAICGVLRPVPEEASEGSEATTLQQVWSQLRAVTDAGVLPANTVISFGVEDPRLRQPHSILDGEFAAGGQKALLETLSEWPVDRMSMKGSIFERQARDVAAARLPSQKAINRRKALAPAGEHPTATAQDPVIPTMLLAPKQSAHGGWTLLLPWKCVLPVWYCLMHYPLTGGGNPRFGGLEQIRQAAFERDQPWFPADYPGTRAGRAWEETEGDKRKGLWARRPKSKRVAWESVPLGPERKGEIGEGWCCDWHKLAGVAQVDASQTPLGQAMPVGTTRFSRRELPRAAAASGADLATVKLKLAGSGVPQTCGRIYRLPTGDESLRKRWLDLDSKKPRERSRPERLVKPPATAPAHVQRRYLAASLLRPAEALQVKDAGYPPVPGEEDLIGFVTTGNFNLSAGKGTALGAILADRLETEAGPEKAGPPEVVHHLCIIRNAGQPVGRLARWELV